MRSLPKINVVNNRSWPYAILICTPLFIYAAISVNTSDSRASATHVQQFNHSHYNPPGTIDGSVDPTLIPDNKAYSLLFRFLSKRYEERDKRLAQTFIKDMGVSDEDVNVLIAASEEFNQLVSQLDRQAIEIKERNRPNLSPETMAQLRLLDQQKENIVTNIVSSLPRRLSRDSIENLRRYINERFKRQMKIVPGR